MFRYCSKIPPCKSCRITGCAPPSRTGFDSESKFRRGWQGDAVLSAPDHARQCRHALRFVTARRDTAAVPVRKLVLAMDLELPGLCVDAERREKDAAGFFRALDKFPFHQFANFIFRDAWDGRDDLKITEAGIDFDCCHGTVSLLHRRQASSIPMG